MSKWTLPERVEETRRRDRQFDRCLFTPEMPRIGLTIMVTPNIFYGCKGYP